MTDVEAYIDGLESIIDFQVENGLVTVIESRGLRTSLENARNLLEDDPNQANRIAHTTFDDYTEIIRNKSLRKKSVYLYGIHLWIYLSIISLISIVVIVKGILDFELFENVSANIIAWSCLGGCAYSIYYVRKNIYQRQLSKYYSIYWMIYPLAGILFGLGIVYMVNAGLIQLEANTPATIYIAIAFLSGMFQEWAIGTFRDLADSLHKPKTR